MFLQSGLKSVDGVCKIHKNVGNEIQIQVKIYFILEGKKRKYAIILRINMKIIIYIVCIFIGGRSF